MNDTPPLSIVKYLRSFCMADNILTYLHIDEEGNLVAWGGYPRHYGLDNLAVGQAATEQLFFLEGMLPLEHSQILKFLALEGGQVAHIHLLPIRSSTWVLLFDASQAHDQQQEMQQQLNELSILSYRQSRMLQDLEETRHKLLEEKQKLAEANKLKGEFIAGLSHELRTPLSSIVGYTKLLDESPAAKEQMSNYLGTVQNNAEQLLGLIDNVLDQARLDSNSVEIKPVTCHVRKLLDNLKQLFFPMAREKRLNFQINISLNTPDHIQIDELHLRQILINLMTNALKFTHEGEVSVNVSWAANTFYFSVKDSGPGIDKAQQEKIFKAFHRSENTQHVQGAGLGLSISYRLVEQMGGKLEVESSLGQGATFHGQVYAPQAQNLSIDHMLEKSQPQDNIHDPAATQIQVSDEPKKATILLAEDSRGIRMLMELYIQEGGYQVLSVEDGEAAVQLALAEQPDLILMDMQMPVLDGFHAVEQLRSKGCVTPIIALSASHIDLDKQQALSVGCNDYLIKPIELQTLLTTLKRFLEPS